MDAKFVVDLWRKLRLMPKVNIADFKLFHYDWSLIPIYEKNSLVIAGAGSPGTFDGNYIITGAPLARFWPLTPCINIYDIDYNLIQRKKIEGPIVCSSDYFVRFNLTGLNSGDYYIRPCIIYNGSDGNDIICESNEEYKITSKPSVKILDIRQTGCSATDHECSDNCGAHFDIKFDYDLVLQVDGCSNCIECGYCVEYIHDRWEYYSAPLSNGVHTISNTVLFGTDNPSFTVYPYVKYANGNIEVGEPFTTQFVGSRSRNKSSYKKANNNSPIISLPHP